MRYAIVVTAAEIQVVRLDSETQGVYVYVPIRTFKLRPAGRCPVERAQDLIWRLEAAEAAEDWEKVYKLQRSRSQDLRRQGDAPYPPSLLTSAHD